MALRPSDPTRVDIAATVSGLQAFPRLQGKRVCLLCFEADASKCHRRFVASALASRLGAEIVNLAPQEED